MENRYILKEKGKDIFGKGKISFSRQAPKRISEALRKCRLPSKRRLPVGRRGNLGKRKEVTQRKNHLEKVEASPRESPWCYGKKETTSGTERCLTFTQLQEIETNYSRHSSKEILCSYITPVFRCKNSDTVFTSFCKRQFKGTE